MKSIKIVFVGDMVGKSCLRGAYEKDEYPTEYNLSLNDVSAITVMVGRKPYTVNLCDTPGQEDFDRLRPLEYKKTDIFLVCFSVVTPDSFNNIGPKWIPEIAHNCPRTPFLLVGTQIDRREDPETLKRLEVDNQFPVKAEDGERLAKELGAIAYVECSALNREGVEEVFEVAILAALKLLQKKKMKGRCTIL